jgi:hypothetical protein
MRSLGSPFMGNGALLPVRGRPTARFWGGERWRRCNAWILFGRDALPHTQQRLLGAAPVFGAAFMRL